MKVTLLDRLLAGVAGLFAGGAVLIGVLGAVDSGDEWVQTYVGGIGSVIVGVACFSWLLGKRR